MRRAVGSWKARHDANAVMTRSLGWDIGGAHLKVALVEEGCLVAARQLPCALWKGLGELHQAADAALDGLPVADCHAVTMTGELVDLFPDRATGVAAILDFLAERIDAERVAVYSTDGAFLTLAEAKARPGNVASANWHATAGYLAATLGTGLLVDVGSTTTDIIPFRTGRIAAHGTSDSERLTTGELAYVGIARTPLAAVARHVPFAGRSVGVMAEFFATSADAHRVAGTLPEGADLHPTADGRGKTPAESRARLARMIGMDAAAAPEWAWRQLAQSFIRQQTRQIEEAIDLVLSETELPADALFIGAGIGRFLVAEIARRLGRTYRGIEEVIRLASPDLASRASDIAPAVAVALLLSASET
jgi:(4-(4-[2-(gamma-L-glutamylamino)ethyl]phenoxymethyl)furan-2-yl)methanamine synthase